MDELIMTMQEILSELQELRASTEFALSDMNEKLVNIESAVESIDLEVTLMDK